MNDRVRKILIVSEANTKPKKIYIDQIPKLTKGLIRLGHDVRQLSYTGIMSQLSPFKSSSLKRRFYKLKTDEVIRRYAEHYQPDIIFVGFARFMDGESLQALRGVAPSAVFIGWDGDPWPSDNKGRIELGRKLDILMATNNGSFLEEYRKAGVAKCVFMPNLIDPDIDHRYAVEEKYRCQVLWTGKVQHKSGLNAGDTTRQEVLDLFAERPDTQIYGCLGHPPIEGIDYLHAISGAKVGISINAINTIAMYHSDRFTHYSACGTMVLAKRVPDTDLLMEDKKHVRYFDTREECLELADWYLSHEDERKKIADAGMAYCHANYNSVKIAGYIMDVIETGRYEAPWGTFT